MSANERIQWFHSRIAGGYFPNSFRLSEKFGISHRQAQRDITFLRGELNAPLVYDAQRRGFRYSTDYSLPVYAASDNDDEYSGLITGRGAEDSADSTVIQLQIPYSAEISVSDKLGVLELNNFITASKGKNRYLCEFHSVELFLGVIVALNADVKILSPDWLRERLVSAAERILRNNK